MKLICKEDVVLCTNILLVIGRDVMTLPSKEKSSVTHILLVMG